MVRPFLLSEVQGAERVSGETDAPSGSEKASQVATTSPGREDAFWPASCCFANGADADVRPSEDRSDGIALMTFAELVAAVAAGRYDFTPDYRKKVLGSLRRCDRHPVFGGAPLHRIIIDLRAFETQFGRGAVRRVPQGFDTPRSFQRWRTEVRGALAQATNRSMPSVSAALPRGWAELRRLCEIRMFEKGFRRSLDLISFDILAKACGDRAIAPDELTSDQLAVFCREAVSAGQRRGYRKAVRDLLGFREKDPEIARLFPQIISLPEKVSDRRKVQALPPAFDAELEDWLARKRQKEFKGFRHHAVALSPRTLADYRKGVRWLVHVARHLGLVGHEFTVHDLANPELLESCVFAEIDRELPFKPLAPNSLKNYLKSSAHFLSCYAPGVAAIRNALFGLPFFDTTGGMAPSRQQWCRELLDDPRKTRRFLSLAGTLFDEAQQAWNDIDERSRLQQQRALRMAIAAAAAALLCSLPLRAGTLIALKVEGSEPNLAFPRGSADVSVNIPASLVKNRTSFEGISLAPRPGNDPRRILDWFVSGPREHLLREAPKEHAERLFPGIDYARFYEIWTAMTARFGVAMVPHLMRHGIASLLINSGKADYTLVAALLGDSEETVRRHYAWIDMRKLHEEGQSRLKDIHAALNLVGR